MMLKSNHPVAYGAVMDNEQRDGLGSRPAGRLPRDADCDRSGQASGTPSLQVVGDATGLDTGLAIGVEARARLGDASGETDGDASGVAQPVAGVPLTTGCSATALPCDVVTAAAPSRTIPNTAMMTQRRIVNPPLCFQSGPVLGRGGSRGTRMGRGPLRSDFRSDQVTIPKPKLTSPWVIGPNQAMHAHRGECAIRFDLVEVTQ